MTFEKVKVDCKVATERCVGRMRSDEFNEGEGN